MGPVRQCRDLSGGVSSLPVSIYSIFAPVGWITSRLYVPVTVNSGIKDQGALKGCFNRTSFIMLTWFTLLLFYVRPSFSFGIGVTLEHELTLPKSILKISSRKT